ncbi:hypothetical protein AC578_3525 [Pseudocercospora eumusae]|uniref:Uncharacterized protein n=1 Tax=Pseudocercospora eumusae TaxID=321146 RepID=A0A139H9H7_9PEZI|nr:hypothetical protein AC578_3525 [Pseudocercospora eumusae]
MDSTQNPFLDPPPYTPMSSWNSDLSRSAEDGGVTISATSAPQRARATPNMTELEHGPASEKLKELLAFVIFRDYVGLCASSGCYTLRASTRDHFLQIAEKIEMERTNASTEMMKHAIELARRARNCRERSLLWRTICEPCRILGLPQDAIVATIMRFYRYRRSLWPKYNGCISRMAKDEDMQSLARKIAVDREVIIPYLDRDGFTMRNNHVKEGLKRVEKQYFVTLDVRDARNLPYIWSYWSQYGDRSLAEEFKITYQLSARGAQAWKYRMLKVNQY